MFKVGDKVFDNERGYGEGVVYHVHTFCLGVSFGEDNLQSYNPNGTWASTPPITLFKKEEMKNYYYVGQKVSHQAWGGWGGYCTRIASKVFSNHSFFWRPP